MIQTDYDIGKAFEKISSKKAFQMTKEIGIYGYKGRIPASFIDYVYFTKKFPLEDATEVYFMGPKDFTKKNKQRSLSYIQKLEDYGYI